MKVVPAQIFAPPFAQAPTAAEVAQQYNHLLGILQQKQGYTRERAAKELRRLVQKHRALQRPEPRLHKKSPASPSKALGVSRPMRRGKL